MCSSSKLDEIFNKKISVTEIEDDNTNDDVSIYENKVHQTIVRFDSFK